jgi:hypothetical protein
VDLFCFPHFFYCRLHVSISFPTFVLNLFVRYMFQAKKRNNKKQTVVYNVSLDEYERQLGRPLTKDEIKRLLEKERLKSLSAQPSVESDNDKKETPWLIE